LQLQFCKDVGIEIKHYLPLNRTHEEWVKQYGLKAREKQKGEVKSAATKGPKLKHG